MKDYHNDKNRHSSIEHYFLFSRNSWK